ncbi:MAG: GDP-mannose 4,6-dehydratase [Candidatus Omnitrophica bacterium]|nr:GDP-mannose 4,6-dehydratase [Candidatus Omnitrophota bacterium]MBU1923365.1 GDP-mannose 4,6-dehydratase [Candidatus Omnitrophota bacterium]
MNIWRNKVVFITGANGFLGGHLVKRALSYKTKVIVLIKEDIRLSLFKVENLGSKCQIYKGDLSNSKLIDSIFKNNKIDVCFHMAAQTIVGIANNSPTGTLKTNIQGTWNMLEAVRNFGVKAMVVASSDKAYGEHKKLPYKEDAPLIALNPYDASKSCTDILSRTYANTYKLPIAVTRCANIYGPGDSNFSRIVPDTCRAIINGKNPVIRSDGTPLRDYVFVEDIVNAYFALAGSLLNKRIMFGEAFNFGVDKPISVIALVKKIINISGNLRLTPEIKGRGKIKGEIDKQYLSSVKAKRILGWSPKWRLEEGLKITYRWYKDHL